MSNNHINVNVNSSISKAHGAVQPLENGWYQVTLGTCFWTSGPKYSKMNFGFRVARGPRTGKMFTAGITFGWQAPGEEVSTDQQRFDKVMILCEIIGLDTSFLGEVDPNSVDMESFARHFKAYLSNGAKPLAVKVSFWSNERVSEGYNLQLVRKV